MSRPETFTLCCDRCTEALTVTDALMARDTWHLLEQGDHKRPQQYTSHRQATLDGNAAGWRMTSLEEVCKACVAKESEPFRGEYELATSLLRTFDELEYTEDELDEEMRRRGLDPGEVAERMRAIARELIHQHRGPGGTSDD